jgi:DNA-binding SARP family transcriptional activator
MDGASDEPASHAASPARDRHANSPITGIFIYTLGDFQVTRQYASGELVEVPAAAWRHGRALALAHYLLTRPDFASSRAAIREELWPRVDPGKSNEHLSNAIWNLRQALGVARDDSAFLKVTNTDIRLNVARPSASGAPASGASGQGLWMDTIAFETAVNRLRSLRTPQERLSAAQRALALYGGDFLPACGEVHWCFAPRERLRGRWAAAMLVSAHASLELDAAEDALRTLDRLLAGAPDHEGGATLALTLLMERGRSREARALYDRLRIWYRGAYHCEPPPALRQVLGPAFKRSSAPLPPRV